MRDESNEMTTSRRLVEGFVPLSLESIDVSSLVKIAARKITVDRVGLADRNIVQRFDNKIAGDLATSALQMWLLHAHSESTVIAYDEIRIDGFHRRDPGWDLAISVESIDPVSLLSPRFDQMVWYLSVKSSRLPSNDRNPESAVERRDFKILKYHTNIWSDLHADVEIQVYYPPKEKNQSLAEMTAGDYRWAVEDLGAVVSGMSDGLRLFDRLGGLGRFEPTVFVGFALAGDLEAVSGSFEMPGTRKQFWKAPLARYSRPASSLPATLEGMPPLTRPTPVQS